MELRQLRHFVVLAEELHFGRAARRLSLTQPALSTSLMRLEDDTRIRLFKRDSKSMALTVAGEAMLARAKEIVSLSEKMEHLGRAIAEGKTAVVEVGFSASMLFRGLDQVLQQLALNYPGIELSLREYSSPVQIDRLRAGRIDAAFINTPAPPEDLEKLVMFKEHFMACLPENHRLASRSQIDVHEFSTDIFMLTEYGSPPAFVDRILAICAAGGFHPRTRSGARSVLTIAPLVSLGLGVSILPESMRRYGISGVVYVSLKGVPPQVTAYMVWNPRRDVPGLAQLIETVRGVGQFGEPVD